MLKEGGGDAFRPKSFELFPRYHNSRKNKNKNKNKPELNPIFKVMGKGHSEQEEGRQPIYAKKWGSISNLQPELLKKLFQKCSKMTGLSNAA